MEHVNMKQMEAANSNTGYWESHGEIKISNEDIRQKSRMETMKVILRKIRLRQIH